MVMKWYRNGSAQEYLRDHGDVDRLLLVTIKHTSKLYAPDMHHYRSVTSRTDSNTFTP